MRFETPLIPGTLIKRYKRFLADISLEDGSIVTAHCPNSGSMKGYKEEGLRVWLSESDNPKRKLRYTWELVEDADGETVMVHAARANALAEEAVREGVVTELQGYDRLRREVKYGSQNSRIDLLLEKGDAKCFVEVKSVTLREGDTLMFPDAVTTRGQKHLEELMEVKEKGDRAVLFFAVLREGGTHFEAAAHIDPAYASLLAQASDAGVEVLIYRAAFAPEGVALGKRIG
ncbi:DNA/RNA nuclease SfsA [Sulfurimonas diazotrophicus]|uniref:Sugar fermentation stimulation protein homolog n=1 Tax=Sulfurimonas diazotrophicus TaxID=3131939 RepID=A0ABZ3H7Q9_9BACT